MDPKFAWSPPEQVGPALDLWTRIIDSHLHKDYLGDPVNPKLSMEFKLHNDDDFIPLAQGISDDPTYDPSSYRKNALNKRKNSENRACTMGLNFAINMPILKEEQLTPWRKGRRKHDWNSKKEKFMYGRGVMGLHQEIIDFYEYMSPREPETYMRQRVVDRLKDLIEELWPEAQVEVFGSFRTGLFLPTSDIDLVVFGNWSTQPLYTLRTALLERKISEPETIKVLDKASVPIVKLTDSETEVKVDVSFNIDSNPNSGVKSAELIKNYMKQYDCLKFLVLVLKQFLVQRDLNEVFSGGISSYALTLLVISFLQLHPRGVSSIKDYNLGVLLIEFFELYGRNFNYLKTAIRVKNGGAYISKEEMCKDMEQGHRPSVLCIEDPLKAGNDIGRSSFQALSVKCAFEYAFLVLNHAVAPVNFHLHKSNESLLGRIIRVTNEVVEYRNWVMKKFGTKSATNGKAETVSKSLSSSTSSVESVPLPSKKKTSHNSPKKPQPVSESQNPNVISYAAIASRKAEARGPTGSLNDLHKTNNGVSSQFSNNENEGSESGGNSSGYKSSSSSDDNDDIDEDYETGEEGTLPPSHPAPEPVPVAPAAPADPPVAARASKAVLAGSQPIRTQEFYRSREPLAGRGSVKKVVAARDGSSSSVSSSASRSAGSTSPYGSPAPAASPGPTPTAHPALRGPRDPREIWENSYSHGAGAAVPAGPTHHSAPRPPPPIHAGARNGEYNSHNRNTDHNTNNGRVNGGGKNNPNNRGGSIPGKPRHKNKKHHRDGYNGYNENSAR